MTPAASSLLAYVADKSPVAGFGQCRGLRVVFFDWRAVAGALGLPDSDGANWRTIESALAELHTGGVLSRFDHGPGCFGDTSTIFHPEKA